MHTQSIAAIQSLATPTGPTAPGTLEDAGLPLDLLVQLALKHLHFAGELTGHQLARRLGLRFAVIAPAIDQLKAQSQLEIVGGGLIGPSAFRYRITDAGRERVAIFLDHNQYVGVAPVPLKQYTAYMQEWERNHPKSVTREGVKQAFSHLVLSDRLLDHLGPAINAGHSLFLYGPPGNGKTVISQGIRRVLQGDLAVPHALEVEGHIVRFFDPVVHEALPVEEDDGLRLMSEADERWVKCRRPLVMAGGELTLESLELTYNPISGFYQAPIQAVANGGVLVIDDFGRQQCEPRQFLNRWIVPLESRIDFLTLQTGQKFELPFNTFVVFATNIRPAELVDEAFLRRIRYKLVVDSPTADDFAQIFQTCCEQRGIQFDRALVDGMLQSYFRPRRVALRGCQPRDLIDQAISLAEYRGLPKTLTADLLVSACSSYFVDDADPTPVAV
jgi:predicted ATPase with chaperone activity